MKNQIAVLNTSILTTFGSYDYKKVSLEEAKLLIKDKDILSAVGHQSTAEILTELLSREIPVNRIQFEQKEGQVALVFKLKGRPEEGKILTREEIEGIGYEFGVLVRLPEVQSHTIAKLDNSLKWLSWINASEYHGLYDGELVSAIKDITGKVNEVVDATNKPKITVEPIMNHDMEFLNKNRDSNGYITPTLSECQLSRDMVDIYLKLNELITTFNKR